MLGVDPQTTRTAPCTSYKNRTNISPNVSSVFCGLESEPPRWGGILAGMCADVVRRLGGLLGLAFLVVKTTFVICEEISDQVFVNFKPRVLRR